MHLPLEGASNSARVRVPECINRGDSHCAFEVELQNTCVYLPIRLRYLRLAEGEGRRPTLGTVSRSMGI